MSNKPSHARNAGRATAIIAAIATSTLLLVGCSPASSNGQVTLTVQEEAEWSGMMGVLVKDFERANPNIKVKLNIITDATKTSTNTQIITGRNAPDLALVPTNSPTYPQLLKAKALEPLTSVWSNQNLVKRYGPETVSTLTADDGKHYVATIDTIYYDIAFYNSDLFKKAGIAVPANHRIPDSATLYSIASKLRASGVQPLAIDGSEATEYGWMTDQLLQSASSSDQIANYLTNYDPKVKVTANYTDSPFLSSAQQIKNWAKHRVFQDGYLGQTDPLALAEFTQKQAGMYLSGNFEVGDLTKSGLKYGWLLLPGVSGGSAAVMPAYHGESMAIPASSKNKAAAEKFLDFWLTDKEQAAAVANSGFALPGVNSVPASLLKKQDPNTVSIVADVAKHGGPVGWTSAAPGAFAQVLAGTNLQSMVTGKMTPEQVATAQQAALLKLRGKN